ncbi:urease accessory protein UreD [Chitinophaga nivalis]|uniref:Urease accessory protein UreD n=1 Tax=Chitinophaga nivalis TaxID=2991709 RepID=A0ABT3IGH7_9BACT|nr:urease accessory protein UreD [Chitinophaga nivalis]MCW3467267.1 urease accessory protein UreD [Chitinophaga nivalis]MCW3483041.1 urease accessory protein UreD [Chitinophaga nivalis]
MINKLSITSGFKQGRSYLKDTFFTRPFRVANVGEHKSDPALYLMVMSSSPGILDGDHYEITLTAEPYSRFQLQSQSYQRLFNMRKGAQQEQYIQLQEHSTFSYVQHPVVPHENAIFKGRNIIRMADDCRLTLGEIITCGRKHSGEVFRFQHFQNVTMIYHHEQLLLKDNVLLQPQLLSMAAVGQMEGYTHQGTLFYVDTGMTNLEALPDDIHALLEEEKDIAVGVSAAGQRAVVVRLLGNGGEQLFNCLRKVQQYLWKL